MSEPENAPTSSADRSVGDLVWEATTHLSTLVRGEIELARLELGASIRRLGRGALFLGVAGVVLFFSLFFPFIALAEGLVSAGLPRWGAYLVVWAVLLILTALFVVCGILFVRKVRKPARTLQTVRDTATWARHPTRVPAGGSLPDNPPSTPDPSGHAGSGPAGDS